MNLEGPMILQIIVTKHIDGLYKIVGMNKEGTIYEFDKLLVTELGMKFDMLQQKLMAPRL